MPGEAVIHPVSVPAAGEPLLLGGIRPLVAAFDPPPARIDAPPDLLAAACEGLEPGPALAEAAAVRLRRQGVALRTGAPEMMDARAFVAFSEQRGRSSAGLWRADRTLLPELQLGAFHHASAAGRAARRLLLHAPRPAAARGRTLRALADAAFWRGVRAVCDDTEWARLTRGYSALLYHRLAGEMKPGQERLDLPPRQFAAQMRVLRRLGFRPLSLADAVAVHTGERVLPRRSVLVTADDAFADCARVLAEHGSRHPALFVPTQAVGSTAHWADGEPIATWPELQALRAAGGELGAHSRTHADLPALDGAALEGEVGGALRDLSDAAADAPATFAYPHGRHDLRVRERVRDAGGVLAFTSAPGRNGAGIDPWCLRRVGVKAYDSLPAVVFKALTGELLPGPWERRLARRAARPSSPPGASAGPAPPSAAPARPPRA